MREATTSPSRSNNPPAPDLPLPWVAHEQPDSLVVTVVVPLVPPAPSVPPLPAFPELPAAPPALALPVSPPLAAPPLPPGIVDPGVPPLAAPPVLRVPPLPGAPPVLPAPPLPLAPPLPGAPPVPAEVAVFPPAPPAPLRPPVPELPPVPEDPASVPPRPPVPPAPASGVDPLSIQDDHDETGLSISWRELLFWIRSILIRGRADALTLRRKIPCASKSDCDARPLLVLLGAFRLVRAQSTGSSSPRCRSLCEISNIRRGKNRHKRTIAAHVYTIQKDDDANLQSLDLGLAAGDWRGMFEQFGWFRCERNGRHQPWLGRCLGKRR